MHIFFNDFSFGRFSFSIPFGDPFLPIRRDFCFVVATIFFPSFMMFVMCSIDITAHNFYDKTRQKWR